VSLDVIVVAYDSADVIGRALSAAAGFAPDARFIVVNNSRGDGVPELVHEVVPDALVIENDTNVGFAAAVNQAISADTADQVLLLNPDIDSIQGDVNAALDLFAREDCISAVGVKLLNEDNSLQRSCEQAPTMSSMLVYNLGLTRLFPNTRVVRSKSGDAESYERVHEVDVACGGFLFISRAAIAQVGPFDEDFFVYHEEADWQVRAKAMGWKTIFCPDVVAVHLSGKGSGAESSTVLPLLYHESQLAYVRKHFGVAAWVMFRAVMLLVDLARLPVIVLRGRERRARVAATRARLRITLTGRRSR